MKVSSKNRKRKEEKGKCREQTCASSLLQDSFYNMTLLMNPADQKNYLFWQMLVLVSNKTVAKKQPNNFILRTKETKKRMKRIVFVSKFSLYISYDHELKIVVLYFIWKSHCFILLSWSLKNGKNEKHIQCMLLILEKREKTEYWTEMYVEGWIVSNKGNKLKAFKNTCCIFMFPIYYVSLKTRMGKLRSWG